MKSATPPALDSNALRTEYPKLFSQTYWGSMRYDEDLVGPEIIANRNDFAARYNIVSHRDCLLNHHLLRFITSLSCPVGVDHLEIYADADKQFNIVVVSPYQQAEPIDNIFPEFYWELIPRLYTTTAVTACIALPYYVPDMRQLVRDVLARELSFYVANFKNFAPKQRRFLIDTAYCAFNAHPGISFEYVLKEVRDYSSRLLRDY